jgi:hypothetical protein
MRAAPSVSYGIMASHLSDLRTGLRPAHLTVCAHARRAS